MHSCQGLLALAAAAVLAAGCGEAGGSSPGDSEAQYPDSVLVDYSRTGGVANVAERLTIHRGGRAQLLGPAQGSDRRIRVPPAELRALERDLRAAGFGGLPPVQDRTIPEPDGFNYRIYYDGHLVDREQADLEPALRPVVRRLDRLVARAG